MAEFRMPSLGADMEAGTLVQWLVKPGDAVRRGDIVAVVETQKGAIEIEVFETGRIDEIFVAPNARVPVGTLLASIRTEGAAAPPPAPPAGPPAVPARLAEQALPPRPVSPAPAGGPGPAGRVRASPAARHLMRLRGLDPAAIEGHGPAGAILYADVERRLREGAGPSGPPRAPGLDLAAMRTAIAAAMARSKREIPHYYLRHDVDVTACEAWLGRRNADRPPDDRLLVGALFVKAVAVALRRFPAFNGFYRDGRFEPAAVAHVGTAIAIRGGGLVAPALHDAAAAPLDALMARMRDLVQRVRAGRIRGSEITDPTITVSSLGERGVGALFGIIYPPQVALVGFGTVEVRPWVVDGAVGPRSIVTVTLSADHRVSDGRSGALFLAEIGRLLQEPESL